MSAAQSGNELVLGIVVSGKSENHRAAHEDRGAEDDAGAVAAIDDQGTCDRGSSQCREADDEG